MKKAIVIPFIFLFFFFGQNVFAQNQNEVFVFNKDLDVGSKGIDVTNLQKFLFSKNFLKEEFITGYFGEMTKKALIEYQKKNNITPALGYFGAKTRGQINSIKNNISDNTKSTKQEKNTKTKTTETKKSNKDSKNNSTTNNSIATISPKSSIGNFSDNSSTSRKTKAPEKINVNPEVANKVVSKIDIPDPVFPNIPSGNHMKSVYISDGDTYAATNPWETGAAISSLIRNGFEYVLNDVPSMPTLKRGASLQSSFFFNSPGTYYNDCINPLETGSLADFNTPFKGTASPSNLYTPNSTTLQSTAQLAYYIDPNMPGTWTDPDKYGGTQTASDKCYYGKINSPLISQYNNAALSNVYLGKTATLSNIGTKTNPINIPGVLAVDTVLKTDQPYSYSGLAVAFNTMPNTLKNLATYDPRTGQIEIPKPEMNYGKNPVIAYSADKKYAMGIYTPQIALEGETSNSDVYLRIPIEGVVTMMSFHKIDYMPVGYYKYKSYYIVGTLEQVKDSMDLIYEYFKILDPKVFDWKYYVSKNSLGSMTEDQARLHWITTGIESGLASSPNFSVKDYLKNNPELNTKFGTNYHSAILNYLNQTPQKLEQAVKITANGSKNLVFKTGDAVKYEWSSTGSDTVSSTISSNDNLKCGFGPWVINTLKGELPTVAPAQYEGCKWMIIITAKNSSTGKEVSETLNIEQRPKTDVSVSNNRTPTSTPDPSVSFTINGGTNLIYKTGDPVKYEWAITNADSVSSTISSNDNLRCGFGSWVINTLNGEISVPSAGPTYEGCQWVITVIAKNSSTGKETSKSIRVEQRSNQSSLNKNLKPGQEGTEVTLLQQTLKNIGYYSGEVTGFFGNLTKNAVSQFQTAHSLEAVGEVGPKTRQLLNSLLGI